LLVTYGGNSVVVEVTDRGPYVGGRDLDLSAVAAEEIGLTYTGVDYVDVEVLN
jgi:rare lipoprotein A